MSIVSDPEPVATRRPAGLRRFWDRQLGHYPDTGPRTRYLAITVLATVVLYYQLYVQGGVATQIIREFGFSFSGFVFVAVLGNLVGAFAALFAGLADRWGRVNLVVAGLFVVGLLTVFVAPNVGSKSAYYAFFAVLNFVEGMVLVATPALIRDFSPQVGRGSAMGFWTMGPVLGSLLVTAVASNTLDSHADWRFQFYVAGSAGLVVAVIAFLGLRELSPRLRDQLMHSMRDRALIEARAAGIDPEKALKGHWRQMFRLDVVGSSFAVSVFLLFYYAMVGFLVVYMGTIFGYTDARANNLGNWYWSVTAVSLVVVGVLSDRLLVRKPFMVGGAAVSLVGIALFAQAATRPETSYETFVAYFVIIAFGSAVGYVSWMAAFTETVERHNPAATATGLAVWGWIQRIVVTVSFAAFTLVVSATTTLVDKGPRLQAIVAEYPGQVKVLQTVDPATLVALQRDPTDQAAQAKALSELTGLSPAEVAANGPQVQQAADQLQSVSQVPKADLAFLAANGPDVAKAAEDSPRQWQTWWWICFAGQLVFIPFAFVLKGRWSPRKAREDEAEHARLVEGELAKLEGLG